MMVVVPALPVGEQGNPPVIGGLIVCGSNPVAPLMGGGIYQPGCVPHEDGPYDDPPDLEGPASPEEKGDGQEELPHPVCSVEETMDRVFRQIRSVGLVPFVLIQLLIEGKQPTHMGPPKSARRAVGVIGLVRPGVMQAMNGHPLNRSVLPSQAPEESQQILKRFPELEGTVGQEPVIAETYTQRAGDPLQGDEDPEGRPAEGEKAS